MAKINLDILKKPEERQNTAVYTDLKLDLEIGRTFNNELYKSGQILDIQSSNNLDAIRNAFISLLTTSPGEKILNPTFGINFGDLLFLPVTEERALVIGETILLNLNNFEPRIKIIGLEVIANEEEQEYIIDFQFTVPRFNNEPFSIKGALNQTGFYNVK